MTPLLLAVPVFVLDLGAGDGGLVEGGDTMQWAWGTPTVGPVGEGRCWATVLDGPYLHDSADWLELPSVDVSSLGRPSLEVRHWYAIAPGDGGRLEIDEGAGFRRRAPIGGYPAPTGFAGTSGGYVDSLWDLSTVAPGARIRLAFQADTAVADDGWFVARIRVLDGDAVAPSVTPLVVPGDTQDLDGPYVLALEVTDDLAVAGVTTFWSVDGAAEVPVVATAAGADTFRATFPGQPVGSVVTVRAEATDGENTAPWPAQGVASFRVFLAAPTGLTADLPPRPVVQRVPLAWDPPASPHAVTAYEVLQDDRVVAEVSAPEAEIVPDPEENTRFSVRALYDVDGTPTPGDPSEPLDLVLEIPALDAVDPAVVWQGETARIAIEGSSLYLQQGEVVARLGEGLAVLDVEVQDAHSASLLVEVDPEAPLGPRDLVLDAPLGTFVFEGTIEVGDDLEAPRIRRVDPASVGQGERVELELEATVPFGGDVVVTTDEDLVLLTDPEVGDRVVRFGLAASSRARIGLHTLVVDDGRRLLTADVLVEEVKVALDTGCQCGTSGSPGPWRPRPWALDASFRGRVPRAGPAAALALLVLRRRRRR